MNLSFSRLRPVVLGGIMLATVAALNATPIGTFRIGGGAEVTATTIDFQQGNGDYVPGPAVDGDGDVLVIQPGTGIFAGLNFGTQGSIVDRTVIPQGSVPAQPAGVPISVMNWLTFSGGPDLALDLTFIQPGTFSSAQCGAAPSNEQTCTPAAPAGFESPYNLNNFTSTSGLSSQAGFSVNGYVRNVVTNAIVGYFTGDFTATFQGQSYQQVLAQIASNGGNGSVVTGYDASFTVTAIPEPGSMSLAAVGAGLAALGVFGRRRFTRN